MYKFQYTTVFIKKYKIKKELKLKKKDQIYINEL